MTLPTKGASGLESVDFDSHVELTDGSIAKKITPVNADGSIIGDTPTVNQASLSATGSVGPYSALNSASGMSFWGGTFAVTMTVEVSPDNGTTWISQPYQQLDLYSTTWTTSNASASSRMVTYPVHGTHIRVRVSAYTSGTVNITTVLSPLTKLPTCQNTISYIHGYSSADAAVSEAPIYCGGRASNALPTAMSADGDKVGRWHDRNGRGHVVEAYSTTEISTATTTVVKSGAGVLSHIWLFAGPTTAGTITIYDNTSATGSPLFTLGSGLSPQRLSFNCLLTTGLTIVTASADRLVAFYS